jgi:hypothetical protein
LFAVHDDFDTLDVLGPLEIFHHAKQEGGEYSISTHDYSIISIALLQESMTTNHTNNQYLTHPLPLPQANPPSKPPSPPRPKASSPPKVSPSKPTSTSTTPSKTSTTTTSSSSPAAAPSPYSTRTCSPFP